MVHRYNIYQIPRDKRKIALVCGWKLRQVTKPAIWYNSKQVDEWVSRIFTAVDIILIKVNSASIPWLSVCRSLKAL